MMLFNCHHVKVMKTALAISIVRQKPKEITMKQFIEKLSIISSESQIDWKTKVESISHELLQLKQKFILAKITPPSAPAMTELVSAPAVTDTSPLKVISESNDRIKSCDKQDNILRHIQFIKYVSDIKRPSLSVSIKRQPSLSVGDINVLDTLKESIIHSLDGMTRVISDECSIPLNSDTISLIIDTVLGVLIEEKMGCYRDILIKSCAQLNTAAINRLTKGSYITNNDCKTVQLVIRKLSVLKELYIDSLRMFVNYTTDTLDKLTLITENPSLLVADCMDNLGASLRCIELLIVSESEHQIPPDVLQQLIGSVESVLFKVDQLLPLVGFIVWRLHALMVNCIN